MVNKFAILLLVIAVNSALWLNIDIANAAEDEPPTITVLASSSLTNVMTELLRIYCANEDISITAAYKSASSLADDIENGDVADVYISDHPLRMRDLKRQGLLDVFSFTTLATNQLALIVSKENVNFAQYSSKTSLKDILDNVPEGENLIIGDPLISPIGIVSQRALERLDIWNKFENSIVKLSNTRNILKYIEWEKALGISYYSDGLNNSNVKILAIFPQYLHDTIVYQAAVVAGENMQYARKFLSFLKSQKARDIFKNHGFLGI